MTPDFQNAYIAGVECLKAWSDVLDDINVFPVADGDTGRNLIISLTPLRYPEKDRKSTITRLLLSARGNSGNIAARFFAGFLMADSYAQLPNAAREGRNLAWQAVHNPVPGTLLTVFDVLADFLIDHPFEDSREYASKIVDRLEMAVLSTPELLPKLKHAGVVDSGALGMYIFLEGFFKRLVGQSDRFRPITRIFKDQMRVSATFQEELQDEFCVDTVLHVDGDVKEKIDRLSVYGSSVVAIAHQDYLKVHLHTHSIRDVKRRMASLGHVLQWTDDNISVQVADFKRHSGQGSVHIMTDAAGSLTRADSRKLGITLLDSYITAGDKSLPETLFSSEELYQSMQAGVKVSTAQASVFERHQYYQRVVNQYSKVLYLCVGSAFTGNFDVASAWKKLNDPDNRLTVMDTKAASGRLGLIAMAAARYAIRSGDPDAVVAFAKRAIDACAEYVFIDKLKYLAAGGRIARPRAFFGDMLHVKPIITPTGEGAKKIGAVKDRDEQLKFAMEKLNAFLATDSAPWIMLEYSDNFAWVNDTVKKCVEESAPLSEILLQPLSLTSGVHMGPGTWAIAFLPELIK
ncbi:MAG: DegV family EDD domain-containing protein [Deltaproteobacteria bacterium]|nr:DegV family EDD domain-containing protein [Deltaproteobacteria bacterium]